MRESENAIIYEILAAWGGHPRLRLARQNTGAAVIRGRFVRFGVPGTADVCGIAAPTGRLIMLEVKTVKGKQSAAQATMERVVTQLGGIYAVCRSLADADAVLTPLVGPR